MKYLIDTNILSELAKNKPNDEVVSWFSAHTSDTLLISSITVGEIAYGIEKKEAGKAKEQLTDWFENVLLEWFKGSIIDLDTELMLRWGKLRASGRTLPVLDSLIAATALASNAVLVTRNTKDFDGIEDLSVENPFGS
jgi:predicted nucleic acid-binding protein